MPPRGISPFKTSPTCRKCVARFDCPLEEIKYFEVPRDRLLNIMTSVVNIGINSKPLNLAMGDFLCINKSAGVTISSGTNTKYNVSIKTEFYREILPELTGDENAIDWNHPI